MRCDYVAGSQLTLQDVCLLGEIIVILLFHICRYEIPLPALGLSHGEIRKKRRMDRCFFNSHAVSHG